MGDLYYRVGIVIYIDSKKGHIMREFGKFLIIAPLLGIVLYGIRDYKSMEVMLSLQEYIISTHGGVCERLNPSVELKYLMDLFPYYVFMIIFSTFIYRHFCYCSVYVFSRCEKRLWWFRNEAAKMFIYTVSYVVLLIVSGVVILHFRNIIEIDKSGMIFLIKHIAVMTLWLYANTLLANILAILIGSRFAVLTIFACQVVCLFSVGTIVTGNDGNITKLQLFRIRSSYYMNIIPTLHTLKGKGEEMFNALRAGIRYSTSIVYYSVFVLVILAIGMLVLQKIDIIDDDREEVN